MARKAFQRTQKNTSEQPCEYAPFNLKNMDYENVLGESKFPTYEQLKSGLIRLIEEGKITREDAGMLLHELRESEDERMMRMIGLALTDVPEERFTSLGATLKDCLAYLERQKDHFRDDTKMVEQKPRDYCSVRDEFDLEGNLVHKPTSTEDMPYITDEHFYERESADSFKYKLAEYMTKCCTKKEGPYGYTYGISAEAILKMAEEELLERGVVQKPAEWSEEDDKMLQRIIRHTESEYQDWCNDKYGNSETVSDGKRSCLERLDWLENRLKSLRPQSHWKPSEEQMEAMEFVIKDYREDGCIATANYLQEILEQIKKL